MTVSPFLKDFGHELSFCLLIFVLGCCDCWLNWPISMLGRTDFNPAKRRFCRTIAALALTLPSFACRNEATQKQIPNLHLVPYQFDIDKELEAIEKASSEPQITYRRTAILKMIGEAFKSKRMKPTMDKDSFAFVFCRSMPAHFAYEYLSYLVNKNGYQIFEDDAAEIAIAKIRVTLQQDDDMAAKHSIEARDFELVRKNNQMDAELFALFENRELSAEDLRKYMNWAVEPKKLKIRAALLVHEYVFQRQLSRESAKKLNSIDNPFHCIVELGRMLKLERHEHRAMLYNFKQCQRFKNLAMTSSKSKRLMPL